MTGGKGVPAMVMKVFVSLLMLGFAIASSADPAASAEEFLDKAAQGGMTEVAAGQLAMNKATTPDVREFAETLVKERRLTQQLLKALAASHDVDLPTAPSREQQETLRELQKKKGAEFEQAYVAAQITAQEEAIALMKAEIERDRNVETKAFAKEMLPTVEAQLKKAYQLARKEQRTAWARG
jgi:putative membrane protein